MDIAGHRVEAVLVEERAAIATEYYAAVLNDAASKGPLVVFSPEGGMDIEEIAASKPDRLRKTRVDILRGFDLDSARAMLGGLGLGADQGPVAETLVALYLAYRENDAELLEINPGPSGHDAPRAGLHPSGASRLLPVGKPNRSRRGRPRNRSRTQPSLARSARPTSEGVSSTSTPAASSALRFDT